MKTFLVIFCIVFTSSCKKPYPIQHLDISKLANFADSIEPMINPQIVNTYNTTNFDGRQILHNDNRHSELGLVNYSNSQTSANEYEIYLIGETTGPDGIVVEAFLAEAYYVPFTGKIAPAKLGGYDLIKIQHRVYKINR